MHKTKKYQESENDLMQENVLRIWTNYMDLAIEIGEE
jgi:hypothetical protein